MRLFYSKSANGFTLIELLVTIAIIGILAATVIVALGSVRAKSRDTRRKVDINEVQRALDVYADDHDGFYPSAAWGDSIANPSGWIPGLAPSYIRELPVDPINKYTSPISTYYYNSNGTDYKLIANNMESGQGRTWAQEDGGKTSRNSCFPIVQGQSCGYELFTYNAQNW